MSKEHPAILYIGSAGDGEALREAAALQGWHVFLPATLHAALGMYMVYMPDACVIDMTANPVLVGEVYLHLRSVNAQPMILLAPSWTLEAGEPTLVLPASTPADALLEVLAELLGTAAHEPLVAFPAVL